MDTVFGRIKLKRGAEAAMPVLQVGEPYFAEDTQTLWAGSVAGNLQVGNNPELAAALGAHLADAVDAHDASAISFSGTLTWTATDVQEALFELDEEKASVAYARALSFLDLS